LVDVEFGCGALLLLEDEDIVVKETLTELEDTDVDNVDLFVVCLLRSLANCC